MEFDDKELKNVLTRLSPKAPSRELEERIAEELASVHESKKVISIRKFSWPLLAGAAATIAVCWTFWSSLLPQDAREELATIEPEEFRMEVASPVLSEPLQDYRKVEDYRVVVAADQGPIYSLGDDELFRNIHIRYMDTQVLENNNGTSRYTIWSPSEEIVVVPANSY